MVGTIGLNVGCPHGANCKVYICEHDMIVIAAKDDFLWMHVPSSALSTPC